MRLAHAELRRLGRLDGARSTAARLMAVAQRLVRDYPKDGHAYRVLSEAFNQIRKNEFHNNDDRLMMESLVQAIAAARRALTIEPAQARFSEPFGQAHPTTRRHRSGTKDSGILDSLMATHRGGLDVLTIRYGRG